MGCNAKWILTSLICQYDDYYVYYNIRDRMVFIMENTDQFEMFELPEVEGRRQHQFSRIHRPIWTKHKAELISLYLRYFVFITKHGVYIDGFAGPQDNCNLSESWAAKLVIENEPKWMRTFFLCDKDKKQIIHLETLRDEQTCGRAINIFHADFNEYIDQILDTEQIGEKTATFCLLDQRTFECNWTTIEKIASRKTKMKIELFYFVPTGWLARSISALNHPVKTMMLWWGRSDWECLYNINSQNIVDLFCRRFKEELGYKYVYGWPIYEQYGSQKIMYYMVHSTDHDEAPKLMERAYKKVTNRDESQMQIDWISSVQHD